MKLQIETACLRLIPATAKYLELELSDIEHLARALGVASVPGDWPPGEYDAGAIGFFLEQTLAAGDAGEGWLSWYALSRQVKHAELFGCGGFLGAPDASGTVEIGYSIVQAARGRGLATEMVMALSSYALNHGARRIIAHTTADNPASIAVLKKSAFDLGGENPEGMLEFVRTS